MQFPLRDLTNQYISLSYQDVVQRYTQGTASYFLDGLGNVIVWVPTSSLGQQILTADSPSSVSASYALTASHALNVGGTSASSSWASSSISASYAFFATLSETASLSFVSLYADQAGQAIVSTYSETASYVAGYNVDGQVSSSQYADFALTAETASFAWYSNSGSFAHTASHALNAPQSATASHLIGSVELSGSLYPDINAPAPSWREGQFFYDNNAKTLAIHTDHPGVTLQIGQESWIRVLAHEDIPNGAPVYISHAEAGMPCAMLAQSTGIGAKYTVIGVSTEAIPSGSIGIVTSQGQVHDLDLSAFMVGSGLWLNYTTSGSFTQFPPPEPYEKVLCGYVLENTSGSSILQVDIVGLPQSDYPFVGFKTSPIVASTGGTQFTVTTASVNLCTTANGLGRVKNYTLQSSSFTINTGSFLTPYYLYADYNSGNPQYAISTDRNVIDSIQRTICYTITPGVAAVSQVSWDAPGNLLANKLFLRSQQVRPIDRASGLTLAESGSKGIVVSSGSIWVGVNNYSLPAVNSSQSRFVLVSHSGSSAWSASFVTSASNYMCDNGTALVPVGGGNNHWIVNYVYRGVGNQNTTIVMLGPDYTSLASAQSAQPPAPPSALFEISILIGRMIYQKNAANATQVDSAFVSQFTPSGISQHNELFGLQGGTTSEYYHLTAAEHSVVSNFVNTGSWISVLNTDTPVIQVATGSYDAAFFDYVAMSGSNTRAGMVFGSWVNGQINYTEVSNVDIGDTSKVTMSLALSTSIIQLIANVTDTTPWKIKALARYL